VKRKLAVHIAGRGTIGLGLTLRTNTFTLKILVRHIESLTLKGRRKGNQSTKMGANVLEIEVWQVSCLHM